jgi:ABC-type iron transport system FetAB permease component
MLWVVGLALIVIWFVLKFILHHGGFVHMLLIGGISILVVQFAAERRTRYQRQSPQKRA